jgi:hypothetical protein
MYFKSKKEMSVQKLNICCELQEFQVPVSQKSKTDWYEDMDVYPDTVQNVKM